MKKIDIPLPAPKPWIRSSAAVLTQAQNKMSVTAPDDDGGERGGR